MSVNLYITVMYQCVYDNLIPIMLRVVYLAERSRLAGLYIYIYIYIFTGTEHQPVIRTQSFYFHFF